MNVTEMQHSLCIVKLGIVSPPFYNATFRLHSPDAMQPLFLFSYFVGKALTVIGKNV